MELRAFDPNQTESVVRFCQDHGFKPLHPERLIRRFITNLSSGPEMTFDLFDGGKRAAVAVLLDRVRNIANCANLEVIAIDTTLVQPRAVFELVLPEAKRRLPPGYDGILLGLTSDDSPLALDELAEFGFLPYYRTFEMKTISPLLPALDLTRWSSLSLRDFETYYSCLQSAFGKNVESSVPDPESVLKGLEAGNAPLPFVRFVGDRIAAFTSVANENSEGEIMTVGVHENFRGQGFGREGLAKGLCELQKLGATSFKLTVEAKNENALSLYKKFGFEVAEHGGCVRYSRI